MICEAIPLMKALVKKAPGFDNMVYTDIPQPAVKGDLVKIKVAYTGVCGTDIHAFRGTYPSTKTPIVLGHEFSGVVSEIGPDAAYMPQSRRPRSGKEMLSAYSERAPLGRWWRKYAARRGRLSSSPK